MFVGEMIVERFAVAAGRFDDIGNRYLFERMLDDQTYE
jgi:hypothetical protein